MAAADLHAGYATFDTDSLRSFSPTLRDEYHDWASESGRPSRNDRLLNDFPRPPSRRTSTLMDTMPGESLPPFTFPNGSQPDGLASPPNGIASPPNGLHSPTNGLDAITEESVHLTPKPSIKNFHRSQVVNGTKDLPLLQQQNPFDGSEEFDPINEEGASYDLIAPYEGGEAPLHKLEKVADVMFSSDHMLTILNNSQYLAQFRDFLIEERPRSMATMIYYLNAKKASRALGYANALVRLSVDVPPPAVKVGEDSVGATTNKILEQRLEDALHALTSEELPAFITSRCISITSKIVAERVRGTLPMKFQGTSDALAEVFCLTDPSRPDNPIIFSSEEFHRTTQYGMDYVLGRNCRFLQGPKTNRNSVRRIGEAIKAGRHHSELFLNYRRDGSPFMNLLQCAPLCDSQGTVRYFIGAQIDVSGLALEGAQMNSLLDLNSKYQDGDEQSIREEPDTSSSKPKDEFQELSELFSPRELATVQDYGGDLFQPLINSRTNACNQRKWMRPVSALDGGDPEMMRALNIKSPFGGRGSLTGVYENYLLVRPCPSLRILFTSPSLQIPGMLQSSFLSRIGSSESVREELLQAMMSGRSVTARIKWVTRYNTEGRNRWIHCTPLLASNGQVGVWMVVVVDDDEEQVLNWRG